VYVRGEVTCHEDLRVDGLVEGSIKLPAHHLVVGPTGHIRGDVFARFVTIAGQAYGTITASELVEIEAGANVEGDIVSPRVALIEGAYFKGRIDPKRSEAAVRVAQYRFDHARDRA
jgi:cytoskeletal protein CcmA (bactofilin family)